MESREERRRVLDAELKHWGAKACDELIAEHQPLATDH